MNRTACLLALGSTLCTTAGCPSVAASEACFVDAHCPDDGVCIDGACLDPEDVEEPDASTGSEEVERLDVGGGIGDATSCAAAGFVATNAGCEFWAVDLPNLWLPGSPHSLDIPSQQTFAVVVANTSEDTNAEVSIFAGNDGTPIETAVVGPLGTYAFLLPNTLQIDPERNGRGRAFRVESDLPITAYQFQPLDNVTPVFSNDASALLPAHVLQPDYIAITDYGTLTDGYPVGFESQSVPTGAFTTVVAVDNGTRVEFVPTDALVPGGAGPVTLDRGETYTIISDPSSEATIDGSLSGTRVSSDKPIAAFSGNIGASIPRDTEECCIDHVEHQLLPAVSWGTRYVVAPPPDPSSSASNDSAVIRLVGAFDGTALRYPAGKPELAPDSIDAYEEAVFTTSEPVVIESEDPDKAFAVAQYLFNSAAANTEGLEGDPAMIIIPSNEQLMDRYVFLTPFGYRTQIVTVVAPESAEISIDDTPLTNSASIGDSAGQLWGYRRLTVSAGAHVISADMPVGVTVVGYDEYVSYAYAGGSAVEAISDVPPAP